MHATGFVREKNPFVVMNGAQKAHSGRTLGALWAYSMVANVPAKTSTWQKHQYGGEFDE
jgi:hypothetical protein